MTDAALPRNATIWERLYAGGGNDLRYPSEVLVRLGATRFDRARDRRILDYGFGTGANLVHFAEQGFQLYGVEVSDHALTRTRQKLTNAGLSAQLRLVTPGAPLPFDSGYFDVTYAWQVLYYNDRAGWAKAVQELERVTRKGGLIIVAIAAPGDVSQLLAEPLGDDTYRSRVPGQEGCVVTIPGRQALAALFPGRELEIGEFNYNFGTTTGRYWILIYRMTES
jgi:SAM-dependent methyltransferase